MTVTNQETRTKINEIAEDAKSLKTTKPAAKKTSERTAPPKAAAKKAVVKKADPKAAAKKAVTKKVEPKAVTKLIAIVLFDKGKCLPTTAIGILIAVPPRPIPTRIPISI